MDNDHTCVCADRHVAYHWFCHCCQPPDGQSQRSAGRFSECGGADRGEAGCHGGCSHGQGRTEVLQLHRNDLHLHSGEQYFRSVRPASPHSGLRCDIASRCSDLPADPLQSVQVPEAERNLGRHVFPAAPLAADLAAH